MENEQPVKEKLPSLTENPEEDPKEQAITKEKIADEQQAKADDCKITIRNNLAKHFTTKILHISNNENLWRLFVWLY